MVLNLIKSCHLCGWFMPDISQGQIVKRSFGLPISAPSPNAVVSGKDKDISWYIGLSLLLRLDSRKLPGLEKPGYRYVRLIFYSFPIELHRKIGQLSIVEENRDSSHDNSRCPSVRRR